MLQAAWPKLDSLARGSLLQAIGSSDGQEVRTFLEALAAGADAWSRDFALRRLSGLGEPVRPPELKALLERIRRTDEGFIRKHPVLSLDIPATEKEQAVPGWIYKAFKYVGLKELCRELELSESALVAASAKDANLLLGLALLAAIQDRLDLLRQIVTQNLPGAWELLAKSGLHHVPLKSAQEVASILAEPYGNNPPTALADWSWLHQRLEGPAPAQVFSLVLRPGWIEELPDLERLGAGWMEVLAALCPPLQRATLRARFATFDSAYSSNALPLLDILDAMENVRPHA